MSHDLLSEPEAGPPRMWVATVSVPCFIEAHHMMDEEAVRQTIVEEFRRIGYGQAVVTGLQTVPEHRQ